jgi:hypothetical protein
MSIVHSNYRVNVNLNNADVLLAVVDGLAFTNPLK